MTACPRLTDPPAGLPPSLETLCLGPFWGASFHVVDISQLSHLRVLKLNRVGVMCGPAISSRLSCLEQLEQLEMSLGGDSCELPVPMTSISLYHLRNLLIDVLGLCSLPETMAAALPELRQLELRSWIPKELPGGIPELTSLTSLTINAPRLTALPQGMSRLSRLRKLELIRCNALQHLPECLTQLHQLILRDTSIPSLPANFVQLIADLALAEWVHRSPRHYPLPSPYPLPPQPSHPPPLPPTPHHPRFPPTTSARAPPMSRILTPRSRRTALTQLLLHRFLLAHESPPCPCSTGTLFTGNLRAAELRLELSAPASPTPASPSPVRCMLGVSWPYLS
ncbi:unnamed protein product [Closterium sp. Naga37s-1]|nr:unnamed protein product [Closterium sp. Naga37s-1]